MMKLKVYNIFFFIMCSSQILNAQNRVFGTVTIEDSELSQGNIFIYDDNTKLLTTTDSKGNYNFLVGWFAVSGTRYYYSRTDRT